MIGAGSDKHELGISAAQNFTAADQAAPKKRAGKGEGTRLGQNGLVEVKEGCRRHKGHGTADIHRLPNIELHPQIA